MTRKELIELLLETGDDNTEVRFAYPSKNYWRDTIAEEVSTVGLGQCRLSANVGDLVLMSDEDVDDAYDNGEAFDVPEMIILA